MSIALRQSLEDFYEKPSTVRVLSRGQSGRAPGGSSGYGPNGSYEAPSLREKENGGRGAAAGGVEAGPGPGSAAAASSRPGTVSGTSRRTDSRPSTAAQACHAVLLHGGLCFFFA